MPDPLTGGPLGTAVDWSPDGNLVITSADGERGTGVGGILRLWEWRTGRILLERDRPADSQCNEIEFSAAPSKTHLASATLLLSSLLLVLAF